MKSPTTPVLACCAVLTWAAPASALLSAGAQTLVHTLPRSAHGAVANKVVTPGNTSQFWSQDWYPGSNLPMGLQVAACAPRFASGGSAGYTANLCLRMENTQLTFGQLSTVMKQNLTAAAVVVFNGPVRFPANGPNPSPLAGHFVPLQAPFGLTGPHLILEWGFTNIQTTGQLFVDQIDMCGGPSLHLPGPPGCGAVLTALHAAGSYTINAVGVPPLAPVHFLFGVDNLAAGGTPYPLDLAPISMPGCSLGLAPLAAVIAFANAGGTASWALPFTPPGNSTFFAQAVHPSAATPLGIATTNTVNSIFGDQGEFRSLFSLDGTTAFPPPPCNSATVLLLR